MKVNAEPEKMDDELNIITGNNGKTTPLQISDAN